MAIVEGQLVEVKWHYSNKEWFINKGYEFTKLNDIFYVKVDDLSKGSSFLVKFKCDLCGDVNEKKYSALSKYPNHYCSEECRRGQKYSKEFMIEEFYRFYNENGMFPTQNDMQAQRGYPSQYYYTKTWGSWVNFLNDIGVEDTLKWTDSETTLLCEIYPNKNKEEIVGLLKGKYSWDAITQKANHLKIKRDHKKFNQPRIKYTKEALIDYFWKLYEELGEYPTAKQMDRRKGFPTLRVYRHYWKSWNDLLKELDIVGENGWLKIDEQVLIELYSTGSREEIIDKLKVKRGWDAIKTKASSLGVRRKSGTKRSFTEDELISKLKNIANDLGRTPRIEDIKEVEDFPSPKTFTLYFGSWNNALRKSGLPLNSDFDTTKEEVLMKARDFYLKYGRSPNYDEIDITRAGYHKHWNNFNEMLLEANLPLNRKTRIAHFKTDEELIQDYKDLFKLLGRIPVANDVNNVEKMASFSTYKQRFGGYKEIWEKCDIENKHIVEASSFGFICIDKNGDVCKSYAELVISNLLIDNNITFIKEYRYSELLPELKGSRLAMDWYLPEERLCVEFFGLYNLKEINKNNDIGNYTRKAEMKKNILKNNNLLLLDIYQEDINETFLQRLVNKFLKFGISIEVKHKNLYKNNPNKEKII